mmetsp:Transcript_46380/g.46841  ORF Transcript_46380/g.46841 Transcript_46380/m.46841 type:complete len:147 (-) Transcript_46380:291-731(-)|eukprot:CAMPEP_0171306858 /NCGR_PEP_ID=MMETSP0816-20121228/16924_1 /TAXON_ID=420281 /ORGANISM="Proboscia inermis, Strain CCAP1064/1" /LENGTH=146 /DNA_ID=CAMNT_0011788727 /DNA_START=66 /DNA_END=506 /DNA_ORIENTATION=-
MKAFSLLATLSWTATAFVQSNKRTFTNSAALNAVPLANGAMSFDRVCREWRCKYTGDKTDSASLEAAAKALEEVLPALKAVSPGVKVNRLVCGGCLDFKIMTTVPLDDFGPWEEKGFAPEEDFLAKLKAIDGLSQIETQTITNMEI